MSRVEAIESEIRQLSPNEFAELREWLLTIDAVSWDQQFDNDANSGKLELLFKQAESDHRQGMSREM